MDIREISERREELAGDFVAWMKEELHKTPKEAEWIASLFIDFLVETAEREEFHGR